MEPIYHLFYETASRVAKSVQNILLNFDTALPVKPQSEVASQTAFSGTHTALN